MPSKVNRTSKRGATFRIALAQACVALTLSTSPAMAQYGLSTTEDGGQVYFHIEERRKNLIEPLQSRIYRFDGDRFELFADEPSSADPAGRGRWNSEGPSVSADGRVVAWTVRESCDVDFEYCPANTFRLTGATLPAGHLPRGQVQLSRNGRYLLQSPDRLSPSILIDLQTGHSEHLPGTASFLSRAVSDDGTVYVRREGRGIVWKAGAIEVFTAGDAQISSDARFLFTAKRLSPERYGLVMYDRPTRSEKVLFEPFVEAGAWSISADGARVLAAFDRSLMLLDTVTGVQRQISFEPGRISAVVLSGDGRVAFAAGAGLVRIEIDSGKRTELLAPLARQYNLPEFAAPGSHIRVENLGPAPIIEIDGKPAAIVESSATTATVQIPWSSQGSSALAVLTDSPFAADWNFKIRPSVPRRYGEAVLHKSPLRTVTAQDPAVIGESILVTLTGLGQTLPPMVDEGRTPASPEFRPAVPFVCSMGRAPARILDVRLMPGLQGIYQVEIEVTTRGDLTCGGASWPIPVSF